MAAIMDVRSPAPRWMIMTVNTLPLLPLRDIVVFPGMVVPLFVGREKSVAALEAAMNASGEGTDGNKDIFLVAQLDPACDDPVADDLYDVGVVASVLQLLKLPDGTVRVLVEGRSRARLVSLAEEGALTLASIEAIEPAQAEGTEVAGMMRSVIDQFHEYAKLNKKLSQDAGESLSDIEDAGKLADTVAAHISTKVSRCTGWRWSSALWRVSWASCRLSGASGGASSVRWRRPSANIT